ncbi:MAG: hypothetical protein KatS3mg076_1068 [Candidatus Binatia bacterium]|nr:MAG: hypothetical protein KatS3mg076_1068 [Candidatus Binatia bacterium]
MERCRERSPGGSGGIPPQAWKDRVRWVATPGRSPGAGRSCVESRPVPVRVPGRERFRGDGNVPSSDGRPSCACCAVPWPRRSPGGVRFSSCVGLSEWGRPRFSPSLRAKRRDAAFGCCAAPAGSPRPLDLSTSGHSSDPRVSESSGKSNSIATLDPLRVSWTRCSASAEGKRVGGVPTSRRRKSGRPFPPFFSGWPRAKARCSSSAKTSSGSTCRRSSPGVSSRRS